MNKHFKQPTTIVKADFILISGDGEEACAQTDRATLLGTRSAAFRYDFMDAVSVFSCCPADGLLRDITEDCAKTWWGHYGEDSTVPAIFERFLADEIDSVAESDIASDRADAWRGERLSEVA